MDNITTSITTKTNTTATGELHTYEMKVFTAPVTIKGETREVTFSGSLKGEDYTSECVFAAQIGNGAKRHRGNVHAFGFESVDAAKRAGYYAADLLLVDNQVVAIQRIAYIRNTQARVVGWADQVAGTAQATQQKYYGAL